jgi:hypothetical protein
MSKKENDHGTNNFDKNRDVEEQNKKRLDQLENIVEKYTRTERHLEQHADIARPEALAHTEEIQKEREEEIENLKNIIVNGKHVNVDETEDLIRNYVYTDDYLENNSSRMEETTLERTKEKQKNREEQLDNLT